MPFRHAPDQRYALSWTRRRSGKISAFGRPGSWSIWWLPQAPVVELVDAPDSKSGTERCVGSIPTGGTTVHCIIRVASPEESQALAFELLEWPLAEGPATPSLGFTMEIG